MNLVVFDLDDTLFSEWDFVRSGMRHISEIAAVSSASPPSELFEFLWKLSVERSGHTFDLFLKTFPEIGKVWTVQELVRAYRSHHPKIDLYPGARELLQELREARIRLGVITDGPSEAQRGKLRALQLMDLLDEAVVTDEFGIEFRKPNSFAFARMSRLLEIEAACCVYIGDNPSKDFAPGRSLGWQTMRLRMVGQLHRHEEASSVEFGADAEVESVADLRNVLRTWCGMQRIEV